MLIRLTIVGIPCLKINAAAGYYQWVRDKRKKIYSSKLQKQLGENVLLLSLINQTLLITPLRSSVCLYLCFFLCFFAFCSSCLWKVRIENWMCIYVALFGIPGTYQNVEMYALTLREQRRFPVEVIIISVLRYNCSIIALFFISSLNHRVFVCYFELIWYRCLYISIYAA